MASEITDIAIFTMLVGAITNSTKKQTAARTATKIQISCLSLRGMGAI